MERLKQMLTAAQDRTVAAQDALQQALHLAEKYMTTLTVLLSVLQLGELGCAHREYNKDCAPCVRREVVQIIKNGVTRP